DRRKRGRPRRRLLHGVMEDAMRSVITWALDCGTKIICGPIAVIRSQVAQYCRLQFFDAVVELPLRERSSR
ncbi:MAG TPA: hypothetical protein VIH70_00335, partial [Actinomycetota bacterium]